MEKVQETEFVPFDVWEEFNKSAFSYFHKGVVICSGDRTESNAMTISWGALGNYLGHRHPMLTVYVAPARYTHELMERYNRFTIMEFDDPEVNIYMGSHSGRPATEGSTCPGKKAADLGLHLAYTPGGTPYYEEARTVMECEIMSALHQSSDDFRNDTPRKLYANFKAGIHTVYIAEIVGAWKKSGKG